MHKDNSQQITENNSMILRAAAAMRQCRLANIETAFTSGIGRGDSLHVEWCDLVGVRNVWYDDDRPRALLMNACNSSTVAA